MKAIGVLLICAVTVLAGDPYYAFSLRAAADETQPPETLGEITTLIGLVHDAERNDFIVVGQRGVGARIPVAELVVAVRARLSHVFPLVSIDRTPDTKATRRQKVRFEGVQNTGFGAKLLAADVRLKRLALGLDEPEQSYFDLCGNDLRRGVQQAQATSTLWFYPSGATLIEREGVFAIRDIKIGVRAQTLAGRPDDLAKRFADRLTTRFDELAAHYPEIGYLRTLYSLVAVAAAVEQYPSESTSAWAQQYRVPLVVTPYDYELVTRRERIGDQELVIDGGVRLAVRNIRLREGDVAALREAVLEARPSPDTLSWAVPIDSWLSTGELLDDLPADARDEGTQISRRVEVVPDPLIYRGPILGNQPLKYPRQGSAGNPGVEARGGVAADVKLRADDIAVQTKEKKK